MPENPQDTALIPTVPTETQTLVTRDAETGEYVEVTADMRARVAAMRRHIEMATLVKAVALRTVADERLYLADGCSSFKDWVHVVLGSSYANAKEYLKIGRRVAPLMPALTEGDGAGGELPEIAEGFPGSLDNERIGQVSALGFKKLSYLTRLDEARFSDIVERGVVTLDGEEFTLDELQEMSSRELTARVREETAELKDKVQEQRSEIDLLEAEKQALLEEREALDEKLVDLRALEDEFRPRKLKLEDKRDAIRSASDALSRLNVDIIAIGVEPDDPETLQEDLAALLSKLQGVEERCRLHYEDVRANLLGLL